MTPKACVDAIANPAALGNDARVAKRIYYAYVMASASGVLYTGVTNNLNRRVATHKLKALPGFTERYNVGRLVYYETFGEVRMAIAREKQIKRLRREKKIVLIESVNPKWADLSADWFS